MRMNVFDSAVVRNITYPYKVITEEKFRRGSRSYLYTVFTSVRHKYKQVRVTNNNKKT